MMHVANLVIWGTKNNNKQPLFSTKTLTGLLIMAGIAFSIFYIQSPASFVQGMGGASNITGGFFADYDRDGVEDQSENLAALSSLFPANGITVSAYDSTGDSNACVVTGNTFDCTVSDLVGSDFRVEFVIAAADITSGWSEGFGALGSSVRFVSGGDTVRFGYMPPTQCSATGLGFEGNPNSIEGKLWTSCFVQNDLTDPLTAMTDVLVGLNYDSQGIGHTGVDFTIEEIGHKNGGIGSADSGDNNSILGSVWGVAYDEWSGNLYTSAFLKRFSQLGTRGLDGLYWMSYPSGTWNSIDLDTLGGPSYGSDPVGRSIPSTPLQRDADVYGDIAKTGIGDIDITPNGQTMVVTNLEAKAVMLYDLSATFTGGNPSYAGSVAITNPGCADTTNINDYQIYAVNAVDSAKVYVGVTCTAENSSNIDVSGFHLDLEAHIVEINIVDTALPTQGSSILEFPLAYSRGCGQSTVACGPNGSFRAWQDTFNPASVAQNGVLPEWFVTDNQPVFSDIEILDDGSLVLGFFDRFSHQMGNYHLPPDAGYANPNDFYLTYAFGETVHVCNTTGNPASVAWIIESQTAACDASTRFDRGAGTYSDFVGGHGGPFNSTSEWYGQDRIALDGDAWGNHQEVTQGGLYARPFTDEVIVTAMDPINYVTGGLGALSTLAGDSSNGRGMELFGTGTSGVFGKGGSLGDVEGCYVPMTIGNYVWLDEDNDGIQDPNEIPLTGVTATLYAADGTTVLATTTTDAQGRYDFDSSDGVDPGLSYFIEFDTSTNSTTLPAGTTNVDLYETTANVAGSGAVDVGDSDAVSGRIPVTTGLSGDNDTSYDAGFSLPTGDVTIDKTIDKAEFTIGETTTATYTLNVTNRGPLDAAGIAVVDNSPDPSLTFNSWTCSVTTAGTGSLTESCSNPSGTGNINETVILNNGGVATFTITAEFDGTGTDPIINQATVQLPGLLPQGFIDAANDDTAEISPAVLGAGSMDNDSTPDPSGSLADTGTPAQWTIAAGLTILSTALAINARRKRTMHQPPEPIT